MRNIIEDYSSTHMKGKWLFRLTIKNILIIFSCTILNILCTLLADSLSLPLFLDCIGTFMSAILLGPVAGAISGALTNVIIDISMSGEVLFALVNISGGIIVGRFFPRKNRDVPFVIIATSLLAGFVMSVISTPLNMMLNDGFVGNMWGDALVEMLTPSINVSIIRCLLGSLLVNMPDKAFSIIIVMAIIYGINCILTRIHNSGNNSGDGNNEHNDDTVKTDDDNKEHEKNKNNAIITSVIILITALPLLYTCNHSTARTVTERTDQNTDYASDYIAVSYGMDNGLASSEINTILQSKDGYIWAGAYSGLYLYNGSSFKQIGLDERISNANELYEDRRGRIWVGTNDSGVFCYDHSTKHMKVYSTDDGLPSDSIHSICEDDDGSMYISTASSLCRISSSGKLTVYDYIPDITSVYTLQNIENGYIAGVTQDGHLFIVKDDKLVLTRQYFNDEISYTAVAYGKDGNMLIGTTSGIFEKLHFDGKDIESLGFLNSTELSSCNYMLYDKNKDGYFLATDTGLGYADSNDKIINLSTDSFHSAVSDIITDYQGNIWFVSSKQGVLKLSLNPFADIFKKAGLKQNVVNATLIHDKTLYIGTDSGIYAVDTDTYTKIKNDSLDIFEGERIRNLMIDDKENLWVSSYGHNGLACISPSGNTTFYNEVPHILGNRFRFTMELSNGDILAVSADGLNIIREGSVITTLGSDNGLVIPHILTAVERTDGSILAGSDGDGIYIIKDGSVTGHIGTDEGLLTLIVLKIIPYNNGFLYVTSNGIYYDDGQGSHIRKLNQFPYKNNYDIFIEKNNAWVMGSAGIYVADVDDMIEDKNYSYVLLNRTWGFNTTLTANAWNSYMNNELFLCCTDGVRRININSYHNFDNNYNIIIDSFTDSDSDITIKDGIYELPAGNADITIQPAVLNYTISNPLINVYIEGLDVPETRQHQLELSGIHYSSIPYGDYKLHIQVLNEKMGNVLKEAIFPIHKDSKLYEHFYYKLYLLFIITLFACFIAWMVAEMRSMALINRQYDQIREAKEEAELANQAKSRFLANMSHEIRTPINTVLGMDEMIMRESSEKEIRGYASDIFTAGNTLLSLINDILDSSKIESGKMEIVPVDYELSTVIRDLVNMVSQKAQDKGLKLEIEIEPSLPSKLNGDDVRIKQVITNILTNAVKYTPSGTVWFRIGGACNAEDNTALLHVEVEDTGMGIKEEDLPKLFQEFQRIDEKKNRNIEGTGLGMNITLQLLKLMGSRLDVESEYGKGSRFYFDLLQLIVDDSPVGSYKEIKERAGDTYSYHESFIAPDAKILVVDDSPMNRKVFRSLLKKTKVIVTEAASGFEALDIVKEQKFDIIFTDHMMPEMDGIETLHHMKDIDNCNGVPIFVLTANAVTGAREQYLEEGFDGFLSKPIVSEKLEQLIKENLPPEKLQPVTENTGKKKKRQKASDQTEAQKNDDGISIEDLPVIDGLDWNYAVLHLPDAELLSSTVNEFYDNIHIHTGKLQELYNTILDSNKSANTNLSDALEAYRIKVHAMKSVAAMIGIVPLAGPAKLLEHAARECDIDTIQSIHNIFINEWLSYEDKLDGVFGINSKPDNTNKPPADSDMLNALFDMLLTAMDDFDIDTVDELTEKLKSYSYTTNVENIMPELIAAIKDMDTDSAEDMINRIKEELIQ